MSWGGSGKKQDSGLTKETQALIDAAMKQRGLSQRATQQAMESLKRGDAQWVDTISTGTAKFQPSMSKTTMVATPKYTKGPGGPMPPAPPASFSGKRMANQIPREQLERERYHGAAPGPDRDVLKDRLAQVMELGPEGVKRQEARMQQLKKEALERAARNKRLDVHEEMIDQVINEIRERREFLESMRAAGQAAKYEEQVRTEIIVRMRELERLGVDVSDGQKPLQRGQMPGAPPKPPGILG